MQIQTESSEESVRSFNEQVIWQTLVQASTVEEFAKAWLEVLCSLVKGCQSGLLLLEDGHNSFAPIALWPPERDLRHLAPVAEQTLTQRNGIVEQKAIPFPRLGYPVLADGQLNGAVVLELNQGHDAVIVESMRIIHWGVGWLALISNRQKLLQTRSQLRQSAFLFDVVLAELGDSDFRQASLAVVNKLAEHFQCHQVLLGMERGKSIEILAVSHSAWFDQKRQWANLASQAMNEAFDQRLRLVWPVAEDAELITHAAHDVYAAETGSQAICSLPLVTGMDLIGVLMLERDTPFSEDDLQFLETLSLALAPVLALKKERQESLWLHAIRRVRYWAQHVMGAEYPGIKLVLGCVAFLVLLSASIPGDFRVSAPAVVEGAVQRAVVAPFDGFVRDAPVRAGDIVHAGQLMLKLEDKDLLLEKNRWESEMELGLRKAREALAKADRASLRQATAQADQARAQLALTQERLQRAALLAPFDGVVVKGDLSQKFGSPVQQGEVQFELAPLDTWRVILKVDERDIAYLDLGNEGELVLASLPGQIRPLSVEKITPIAIAEEGRNYFRVEAKLGQDAHDIRPNMEGVGKVFAGQRSWLWIWTHRFLEWVQLTWWEWKP